MNLFLEVGLRNENFLRVGDLAVDLLAAAVSVDDLPQDDAVVVGHGHHVAVVMRHLHLIQQQQRRQQ